MWSPLCIILRAGIMIEGVTGLWESSPLGMVWSSFRIRTWPRERPNNHSPTFQGWEHTDRQPDPGSGSDISHSGV